jgi:hypothetical protein
MDVKKLDEVLQRIVRITAPTSQALETSQAAVKPLVELQAALIADPRAEISTNRGLENVLGVLRHHVATESVRTTREYYENVLSTVARLKS